MYVNVLEAFPHSSIGYAPFGDTSKAKYAAGQPIVDQEEAKACSHTHNNNARQNLMVNCPQSSFNNIYIGIG